MEFQYGNYKDQYPVGDIYIKEFGLYIISNENQIPTMTVDTTLPTILVKGTALDLSKYVKAHDVEDGDLTVKITGNVDTNTKGTYTVKFEAIDSNNAVVEEEITFTVLNEADTTAPVITIPEGFDIPEALLIDSYTTDGVKNAVMGAIIITDTCDGETYTIPAKEASWNWGGFDMSKVGKYTLTITVTDASGNKATLSKTVKVVKELTPNADTVIKDLMPDPNGNGNTNENVTVATNANETVISLTDTSSQWVSYNKIKYQIDGGFEVGKTFKVILTVKADAARKIQVQVKAHKDWSDYRNFVSEVIDLTTEYQTFEFTFEYDGLTTGGTQANYVDVEFQVGTDNDIFQGIDVANKIYLTKFEIVEPAPVKQIKKFDVLTNGKSYSDGSSVTFTTNEDGTLTWSTIYGKYFGWNSFKCIEGMNYFVFTIKVEEGKKFNFNYKVDADGNPYNGQQVNRVAEGEMTFIITLADITSNSTEFVKFCMWSYATTGTKLLSLKHSSVMNYQNK